MNRGGKRGTFSAAQETEVHYPLFKGILLCHQVLLHTVSALYLKGGKYKSDYLTIMNSAVKFRTPNIEKYDIQRAKRDILTPGPDKLTPE